MKRNKSCNGENKTRKYPPPLYSKYVQQKLEILHPLNIREVSSNCARALCCKETKNSTPGEFESSGIRANEKGKERARQGKYIKGASWTPGARGGGTEETKGVWGKAVGTIPGSQMAVIKGSKKVKKPGACQPQTRLGMEVSMLAVDSPLLRVPY